MTSPGLRPSLSMRIVAGLLVTLGSCLLTLAEADSEAFFLPNLLSRSGSRGPRQISRPRPALRPIRQTQFRHAPHVSHVPQHHHNRHVQAQRPVRQTKAIFGHQPSLRPHNPHQHGGHGRQNNFAQPPRSDPGARMKLDFGGWKPINFDEELPSKLKRGIKIADLKSVSDSVNSGKIVTIDSAIARAPPAESDPQPHITVTQPPVSHHKPSVSQVSHIRIPSTADHNSIIYVDSSNDPIYNLLDSNNPAVAPKYEPAKPVFQTPQYIPRPAVPSKPIQPQPRPQPAVAPRYQPQPAPAPARPPPYEPNPAPAVPPPYEAPAPSVSYEPASFLQSSAPLTPAPAPAYEPEQVAYPVVSQLPRKAPAPAPDTDKYPVVALITADSDVPEEEKFVQFSINGGSPSSLVGVPESQPSPRQPKDVAKESDELYYIYYQDPALDPNFGVKSERDARGTQQHVGLDGLDIPLYDYEELAEDLFRTERDQPSYGGRTGSSRVSFRQNVGGKKSGFTYKLS